MKDVGIEQHVMPATVGTDKAIGIENPLAQRNCNNPGFETFAG
jgi:hypothetical protein